MRAESLQLETRQTVYPGSYMSKKTVKAVVKKIHIILRMEIATGAAQPIVGKDRESVVIYQVHHLLGLICFSYLT